MELTVIKQQVLIDYLEDSSKVIAKYGKDHNNIADIMLAKVAITIKDLIIKEQADEFDELLGK